MRKVLVFSTLSNTATPVETSATTWGELSDYLKNKGIYNPSGMKAIVKENRTTLELRDAALPDTEFVLILVPLKVDSGATIDADSLEEFLEKKFEEFEEEIMEYIKNNLVNNDELAGIILEVKSIRDELGL